MVLINDNLRWKQGLFLFLCLSLISSCDNPFSHNSLKMGDVKVYLSNNDIVIDNFHGPAMGIAGFPSESWGNFSFEKVDEFVYNIAKKTDYDYLWIVLKYASEDKYGNKTISAPITIGKIDAKEAKKYIDYSKWHLFNKTYDMWAKDRPAYEREINRRMQNSGVSTIIVPAYKPKSIR